MNPGICRWREVEKCYRQKGGDTTARGIRSLSFRDLALDDRLSVDAAAIALLLTKLVPSTAFDALLDGEHLPQSEYVQDEQPCEDPELHYSTPMNLRSRKNPSVQRESMRLALARFLHLRSMALKPLNMRNVALPSMFSQMLAFPPFPQMK